MTNTIQGELFPRPAPGCLMAAIRSKLPTADMLTVSDVAGAVNVSVNTVYAWIESGAVEAINLGGAARPYWKIYRASVVAHLEKRMAGAS